MPGQANTWPFQVNTGPPKAKQGHLRHANYPPRAIQDSLRPTRGPPRATQSSRVSALLGRTRAFIDRQRSLVGLEGPYSTRDLLGRRKALITLPIFNLNFIDVNLNLTGFDLNLRNFNLNLTCFNLNLTCFNLNLANFNMNLRYFKLNLAYINLNLTYFNLCLTYFHLNLKRCRWHCTCSKATNQDIMSKAWSQCPGNWHVVNA